LGEGVGCFIVSREDIMKFETIELLPEIYDLLSVCHYEGVTVVRHPHDLVDDKLRVTTDVKPLNPELGSNVHAIDEGLILHHIVGCAEV
jgi:hypothetical protein